jgi:hypothetical protein
MAERDQRQQRADEEADAAAREAADIGGPGAEEDVPEERRPVVEAGGGEAEGVERFQEELVEAATHGEVGPDPTEDEGEQEEDRS